MKKYLLITLVLLLSAWLAGCSGSRVDGVGDGSHDAIALTKGPEIPLDKVTNWDGSPPRGSTVPDPVPDYSGWCMYYGQYYKYGGAELELDPDGMDPGWYMHYWLTLDAADDGWGFYQLHVGYWITIDDNFPKKGGIPGKYQDKWEWVPVYDGTPPTDYYLPLSDYDPDTYGYLAVHAVVIKGEWVLNDAGTWVWNTTANETGWGGACGPGKGQSDEDFDPWGDNTWDKKWGGWTTPGSSPSLPVFTPTDWHCTGSAHYPPLAYWKIYFNPDIVEANSPFVPKYWEAEPWGGWCTDPRTWGGGDSLVKLYSCYDPTLPTYAMSDHWDLISWILNEYMDPGGSLYGYNWQYIQRAIWHFKYGNAGGLAPTSTGSGVPYTANTPGVKAVIDAALAYGENYYPGEGEWYAVILWPGVNANGETLFQMNIIAVDP